MTHPFFRYALSILAIGTLAASQGCSASRTSHTTPSLEPIPTLRLDRDIYPPEDGRTLLRFYLENNPTFQYQMPPEYFQGNQVELSTTMIFARRRHLLGDRLWIESYLEYLESPSATGFTDEFAMGLAFLANPRALENLAKSRQDSFTAGRLTPSEREWGALKSALKQEIIDIERQRAAMLVYEDYGLHDMGPIEF